MPDPGAAPAGTPADGHALALAKDVAARRAFGVGYGRGIWPGRAP